MKVVGAVLFVLAFVIPARAESLFDNPTLTPGDIIITDWFGDAIWVYSSTGELKGALAGPNSGNRPRGYAGGSYVATDSAGNVYTNRMCCPPPDIADPHPGVSIFKFAPDGSMPVMIPPPQGSSLTGIAVNQAGTMFIGDHVTNSIRIYSAEGVETGAIPVPFQPGLVKHGIGNDLWITYVDASGAFRLAQLNLSTQSIAQTIDFTGYALGGLAVASDGTLYASRLTPGQTTIDHLSATGELLRVFATHPNNMIGSVEFNVAALAFDQYGNLFSGSWTGAGTDYAVYRFSPDGVGRFLFSHYWGNDIAVVRLAVGPPTDKDDCKRDGWRTFNTPRTFKNQGDCIQFVNTGK